jgi:hypothetical protein
MDGSSSRRSYAIVARRESIALGIKFEGMADGTGFGLPGKTYVGFRIRSARCPEGGPDCGANPDPGNVVSLAQHQLQPSKAWPGLSFEKINDERASLVVGRFVDGSIATQTAAVLAQLQGGEVFTELVEYLANRVQPKQWVVEKDALRQWLLTQARPHLRALTKKIVVEQAAALAHQEFAATVNSQPERVAAHRKEWRAIFQKHVLAGLMAARKAPAGPASKDVSAPKEL